jgi:uncharacterized protein (TIGR00369 family)
MPERAERSTEQAIRDRLSASPFHTEMGIVLDRAGDGEVELHIDAEARHANLHGTVHGGVLATLADTAAGIAVRSEMSDPAAAHATVHLDVQYLAPASVGRLHATGRVVKLGRRLAFAQAWIDDGGGRAIARAQATIALAGDGASQ